MYERIAGQIARAGREMKFVVGVGPGSRFAGVSSWWEMRERDRGTFLVPACIYPYTKPMHRLDTRLVFLKLCTAGYLNHR